MFKAVVCMIAVLAMGFMIPEARPDDSVFGLTRSVTAPQDSVTSLPYSNQWISEKIGSYIYLDYNSARMASSVVNVGIYQSNYGSTGYGYPSIDLFSHLISFAGAESPSFARDLSIWGRFGIGVADLTGSLGSSVIPIDSSIEQASLLLLQSRVGLMLGYDGLRWIRPYFGMELDPYVFRNTADLTGAEEQGGGFSYGPVIGAHFPVLFGKKASLLAEYHRNFAIQGAGQLFGVSDTFSAGLGLTF